MEKDIENYHGESFLDVFNIRGDQKFVDFKDWDGDTPFYRFRSARLEKDKLTPKEQLKSLISMKGYLEIWIEEECKKIRKRKQKDIEDLEYAISILNAKVILQAHEEKMKKQDGKL